MGGRGDPKMEGWEDGKMSGMRDSACGARFGFLVRWNVRLRDGQSMAALRGGLEPQPIPRRLAGLGLRQAELHAYRRLEGERFRELAGLLCKFGRGEF